MRPAKPPQRQTGPMVFIVVLAGFGICWSVLRPMSDRGARKARYAECPTNLELLAERLAQLPPTSPCGPWPATPPHKAPSAVADAPACLIALGFDPELLLWGQYALRPSGSGWLATCAMDLDGDGEQAVWEADDQRTASRRVGSED